MTNKNHEFNQERLEELAMHLGMKVELIPILHSDKGAYNRFENSVDSCLEVYADFSTPYSSVYLPVNSKIPKCLAVRSGRIMTVPNFRESSLNFRNYYGIKREPRDIVDLITERYEPKTVEKINALKQAIKKGPTRKQKREWKSCRLTGVPWDTQENLKDHWVAELEKYEIDLKYFVEKSREKKNFIGGIERVTSMLKHSHRKEIYYGTLL